MSTSGFSEIPRYTLIKNNDGGVSLGRKFRDAPTTKAKNSNTDEQNCMFCKKADRPFNHLMRKDNDPEGEIVCEYLLTIKCEHCKDCGHTKKYCPYNKNSDYILSSGNKYTYVGESSLKSNNTVSSDVTSIKSLNNSIDKSFTDSDSEFINKSSNKFCQFCEKNNVPESICKNHNMFETTDGNVVLSCPLFYYLNNNKSESESKSKIENNKSILSKPKLSDEPDISPKNKNIIVSKKDSPFVSLSLQKEKGNINQLNCSIESIKSNESLSTRESVESSDLNNMLRNLKCFDDNSSITDSLSNSLNNSFDNSFNGSSDNSFTDNENSSVSNIFSSNDKSNMNQNYFNNVPYNPHYSYPFAYHNPYYQYYQNGYIGNLFGQQMHLPMQIPMQQNNMQQNNIQQNNMQQNNMQQSNMQFNQVTPNNVIKTRTTTSTYYTSPSPSPSPLPSVNSSNNGI